MAIALLVDDDTDDLEFLEQAILEIRPEVSVVKVNDGLKALLALERIRPDYIFLDINMPAMSGVECLKKLRANKHCEATTVTVMSTSVTPKNILECNALNANCVDKPNNYNSLIEIVSKIFEIHPITN